MQDEHCVKHVVKPLLHCFQPSCSLPALCMTHRMQHVQNDRTQTMLAGQDLFGIYILLSKASLLARWSEASCSALMG